MSSGLPGPGEAGKRSVKVDESSGALPRAGQDPWDAAFARLLSAQSALHTHLGITDETVPKEAIYALSEELERILPSYDGEMAIHPIGVDDAGRVVAALEFTSMGRWLIPNSELLKKSPNIEPDEPTSSGESGARRRVRVATLVRNGQGGYSDFEVVDAPVRCIVRKNLDAAGGYEMFPASNSPDALKTLRQHFASGEGLSVVLTMFNEKVEREIQRRVGMELKGAPDYAERSLDASTGALSAVLALPSKEWNGPTLAIQLGPYAFGPDEAGILRITGGGWREMGPMKDSAL